MASAATPADHFSADDWIDALLRDAEVLGEKYQQASSSFDGRSSLGEDRQHIAMALLGRLTDAMNKLPGGVVNPGIAILHDLSGAMGDLIRGNVPSLLQAQDGGVGRDPLGRSWVKNHALLFIATLIDAGMKPKGARVRVASLLTIAGHRGRQGGVITQKTIWEWETRADERARAFVARNRPRMRALLAPVPTLKRADNLVVEMIDSPAMRSKI